MANEESPAVTDGRPSGLNVASGVFAAAMFLAFCDVAAIAIRVKLPASGVGLQVADAAFDIAETLGLGGLLALAVGAFARLTRASRWVGIAAAAALIVPSLWVVIGENVSRGVQFVLPNPYRGVGYWAYIGGIAVLLPVAFTVGLSYAKTPIMRLASVALAVVATCVDHVPMYDDYQGVHGVFACGAALLAGGALSDLVARLVERLRPLPRGRAALAGVALFSALGVVVPPPNSVRYELFRQPCVVAPWVLATVLWRAPKLHDPVPPMAPSPWFRDRSSDPAVPPSDHPEVPKDMIVVMLTIDAMRADDVLDPANARLFPTFTALRRDGVTFSHAMAAGTQTPLSIAALFSGRTYSEQLWTEHGEDTTRFLYPADDTGVRFPELLSAHDINTFNIAGLIFLQNGFGVLRGFREETVTVTTARHAQAPELVQPLLNRLKHWTTGPLFLYTHLTEPHEPYDRGRKDGTPHERYLSEISVADTYVGRVVTLLKHRFPKRWALFVSSDHGEAFGEHGTHEHAKSLYEELLHVPLFAASPLFKPREVDAPVTLVDLGPTVLDLYGIDTPATFLGESLVPFLLGGSRDFTRPRFAEGRLRRALVFPDGLKVIEDLRRKFVEVYDLTKDPGETRNLFDTDPARSDAALATLRAFFSAHTRTEGGYVPPFKP